MPQPALHWRQLSVWSAHACASVLILIKATPKIIAREMLCKKIQSCDEWVCLFAPIYWVIFLSRWFEPPHVYGVVCFLSAFIHLTLCQLCVSLKLYLSHSKDEWNQVCWHKRDNQWFSNSVKRAVLLVTCFWKVINHYLSLVFFFQRLCKMIMWYPFVIYFIISMVF